MAKGKETRKQIQNGKKTNSYEIVDKISQEYDKTKCIWTFDRIDKDGEFAFDTSRKDFDSKFVFEKMIAYNSMTWAKIKNQTHDKGKSKHHYIKDTKNLSKVCQDRIKKMELYEETDNLFSFALNNKIRIFGLVQSGIFHVLWYDPNHEIYPSHKKIHK